MKPPHIEKLSAEFSLYEPFATLWRDVYGVRFNIGYHGSQKDRRAFRDWYRLYSQTTPTEFVAIAEREWNKGKYAKSCSLTIEGVCNNWHTLWARNSLCTQTKPVETVWQLKTALEAAQVELKQLGKTKPSRYATTEQYEAWCNTLVGIRYKEVKKQCDGLTKRIAQAV